MYLIKRSKCFILAATLLTLAACGGGGGGGGGGGIVNPVPVAVTVAGTVSYEFVNPNPACRGLNFNDIDVRPIRQATVQLVDSGGSVLGTTVADDDGRYSFASVGPNLDVRIRVRAELKRSGAPSWDVDVRDNVDLSVGAPPVEQRPVYVVDFPIFSSGTNNTGTADFVARTGWGGSSYTGNRAAAPFAILDAIYAGMSLVLSVDATANFPALDAFWSVNNIIVDTLDVDAGELPASFYRNGQLFLPGDESTNTGEFDAHVSVHEWGHYFEDNFSRSDSIGGQHFLGGTIDARLAFSEGWATALAAMALDDPLACNTGAAGSNGGFGSDSETFNIGPQGFYNEMSVATFLYDLFDTDVDGTDTGSIGFAPIFDIMTGPQANTEAFTTLFSFATALRDSVAGADLTFVDSQLMRENITLAGLDDFGSTQVTMPAGARDVLPVYTDLVPDGTTLSICTNSDFDGDRFGNRLSEHRFLRVTTSSSAAYTVTASANPPPPPTADAPPTPPDVIRDRSDPDVFVFRDGELVTLGLSGDADTEILVTPTLVADTYVIGLQEFRYSDDAASSDFPEQICFDVSMSPQ